MPENKTTDRGFAAIMALLVVISLVLVVALSTIIIIVNEKQIDKNLVDSAQSYYSAESGIEDGILRVVKGYAYAAVNNFNLDESVVGQNITPDGNTMTIESSSSHFNNERKIQASLFVSTSKIEFHYGLQIGAGGLKMENNSFVEGGIYSNGSIEGVSVADIRGNVYVATGIFVDQEWTGGSDDFIFGKAVPVVDVAQKFKPIESGELSQISLYIKRIGNVTDKTIRIFGGNDDYPSGAQLASTTLSSSKIGTEYSWVNSSFDTPASLNNTDWYWILIDTLPDKSKYLSIKTGTGYGGGALKYSADWSTENPDDWAEEEGFNSLNFKIWMGGLPTHLSNVTVEGDAHANTINNSEICGDAYCKTIDSFSLEFLNDPDNNVCDDPTDGSVFYDEPDPTIKALPISDGNIDDWTTFAENAGELDSSLCSPDENITLNAGVLNCDFTPESGTIVTLRGTVHIKGNMTLGVGTGLTLSSEYEIPTSGVIIVDGVVTIGNNAAICGSQGIIPGSPPVCGASNGSHILVLSTYPLYPDPLFPETEEAAIIINNSAQGAIFYASNGLINIFNAAVLKEVVAEKLKLENDAGVIYESGLANTIFTNGPGGGWVINDWNEIE